MASTDTIIGDQDFTARPAEDDDPPFRKPDWRQGLEVMPHHFQAQDRYAEQILSFSLGLAFDRPWGITALEIDQDALARANQFAVHRLRGLFPDGTPIAVGKGGNTLIAPRGLDTHFRGRSSLTVYAAIAPEAPGRGLTTNELGSARRRFALDSATVLDANTGERPIPVPWLRPQVTFLFEGERLDEHVVLPIARLQRSATGRVEFDPKFVPPVLRVLASPVLEETLRTLESTLTGTCAALAEARSGGGERGSSEANRLVLSMLLGRALPRVRFLLGETDVHPREAYRLLAELVGALSPIVPSGRATIPPYDYLDLGGVFDALVTEAHDILDALSGARYRAVPIRPHQEGRWFADLREPGTFAMDVEFLLVIRASDPAQLRSYGPRTLKVSAWEDLPGLVGASMPGVEVLPEPRRPPGLVVPERAVVFRLERRGPHWENIVRKASLGIFAPPGFAEDVTLFLEQRGVL